jgi:hypothetical protein
VKKIQVGDPESMSQDIVAQNIEQLEGFELLQTEASDSLFPNLEIPFCHHELSNQCEAFDQNLTHVLPELIQVSITTAEISSDSTVPVPAMKFTLFVDDFFILVSQVSPSKWRLRRVAMLTKLRLFHKLINK